MVVVYFSDNELHCLDVLYGVSALIRNVQPVELWKVEHRTVNEYIARVDNTIKVFVIFLSYNCFDILLDISKKIKEKNKDCIIIACNSLATMFSERILSEIEYIDVCINGEYDSVLLDLCKSIYEKGEYKKCKGISFIEDGEYKENAYEPLLNIESLSFPDRGMMDHSTRFFHVYGSRGCQGHCTFCDRNSVYGKFRNSCFRQRSIKNIMREVDLLVDKYNCKFISFSDATFGTQEDIVERLEQLYECLERRDYWVQFTLNLRAEFITEAIIPCLRKLAKVGLGKVFIGIESFVESDLKMYGKIANSSSMKKCVKILNEINHRANDYFIYVEYGFILFNPYTTLEDIKENLEQCRKNSIKLTPYIISSKLTLNAFTTLTAQVQRDGLFIKSILNFSLSELFQYKFKYKFKQDIIETIYHYIVWCCEKMEIHNNNGLEFVRNRYFHFIGYDTVIKKYDEVYQSLVDSIDEVCRRILELILCSENERNMLSICNRICEDFRQQYNKLDKSMKLIYQRAIIELKKIDEVVYYKPVF